MRFWLPLILALGVGLAAGTPGAAAGDRPVLRVAVLPDQNPATLRERYNPLLDHLASACDVTPELVLPADYAGLVKAFTRGRADLGWFGGVTFVMAHRRAGVDPLVMRDIDFRFTSWFIKRADDPRQSIDAFEDAAFTFGSPLSNSAHLRPRHFLKRHEGITAEAFFGSVRYAGAHDAVVRAVVAGRADLGAVNAEVVGAMQRDGRVDSGAIEVVAKTPPYAAYVWGTRAGMPQKRRTCLRDAFMRLCFVKPDDRVVLRRLGARTYFPAGIGQYRTLMAIAERLDVLTMAAGGETAP